MNYIAPFDCVYGLNCLQPESIECAVTSPPWDNQFEYGGHTWDFKATANELYRVVVPGGVVCWNVKDQIVKGAISLTSHRQALFFVECGFVCHEILIIDKGFGRSDGHLNRNGSPPELVYVFKKGRRLRAFNPIYDRKNKNENVGLRHRYIMRKRDGSKVKELGSIVQEYGQRYAIWRMSPYLPNDYTSEHPARMQEELARDLIYTYSNPGDTILDPLMGVATTCKMALLMHRHYIGFEIHLPYFRRAQRRMNEAWQKYIDL